MKQARYGFLTKVVLTILLLANLLASYLYFSLPTNSSFLSQTYGEVDPLAAYATGGFAAINAGLIAAIFYRIKWGLLGMWFIAVTNAAVHVTIGFGTGLAFAGLTVPAILSLLFVQKRTTLK